jgi:hypothetical protein
MLTWPARLLTPAGSENMEITVVVEEVSGGETAAAREKPAGVTLTGVTLVMAICAPAGHAPKA